MTPADYRAVVKAASAIAERAAGQDGFVTLEKLRHEIGAEVAFRPLLVEGIIAQPKERGMRWMVLIDNETHPYTGDDLEKESSTQPLTVRLRNTLAHELAHTLAFRTEELKIEISGSRADAIKKIEAETENLSPLLLIPYTTLQNLFREKPTLRRIVEFKNHHFVSNEVLLRRFDALRHLENHPLQFTPRNLAVGVGEKKGTSFILQDWPLFQRFTPYTPNFIVQLKDKVSPSLTEIFPDPDFIINGGSKFSTSAIIDAGTSQNPTGERIQVTFEMEETPGRFLWLLTVS